MDELTHIMRIMTTQPDSGLANRRPGTQAVPRRTAKTPGRPKTGARRGHHEIFINGRHKLPSGSSIAGIHTDWESRVRRQSGRLGVHLPSVANDRFWDSLGLASWTRRAWIIAIAGCSGTTNPRRRHCIHANASTSLRGTFPIMEIVRRYKGRALSSIIGSPALESWSALPRPSPLRSQSLPSSKLYLLRG